MNGSLQAIGTVFDELVAEFYQHSKFSVIEEAKAAPHMIPLDDDNKYCSIEVALFMNNFSCQFDALCIFVS